MHREISDLDLFVQTSSSGLGLYKEDLGLIFLYIQTSRSVNKNLINIHEKMIQKQTHGHFQARSIFLMEPFLVFSYLENLHFTLILVDVVGSVGYRSSFGGLAGFLFTPYNNLFKMKGCSVSNKID
jgi:hypothetical protein